MTTTEHLQKIKSECERLLALPKNKLLVQHQNCGCQVCICEDEHQCHGCGAKYCGNHPVGEIPSPIYINNHAEAGWRSTIAAIDSCISDDPRYQAMFELANENMIKSILAAWPTELLS
jgi:hypothetical protein